MYLNAGGQSDWVQDNFLAIRSGPVSLSIITLRLFVVPRVEIRTGEGAGGGDGDRDVGGSGGGGGVAAATPRVPPIKSRLRLRAGASASRANDRVFCVVVGMAKRCACMYT